MPAVTWTAASPSSLYTLVLQDMDGGFNHLLVFNIPASGNVSAGLTIHGCVRAFRVRAARGLRYRDTTWHKIVYNHDRGGCSCQTPVATQVSLCWTDDCTRGPL